MAAIKIGTSGLIQQPTTYSFTPAGGQIATYRYVGTQAEAEAKIPDPEERARLIERGGVVGTGDAIRAWIDQFAAVGVQEIMIQWVDDLDDLDGIRALGDAVIR